jgi:gas vesicle protein
MMAQKKNETVLSVEEVEMVPTSEETVTAGSFVKTFWDQYEQSTERAEQLRENREDAYINALREWIKFNRQYRKAIAKLYEQSKKTNKELVSELMHQINSRREEKKEEIPAVTDGDELRKQLKEVGGQVERLAITPIKSFVNLIDQLEDSFEKNAESSVAYARERRNAWLQVRREYIKLARRTHLNMVERGKSSLKELVKTL